MAYRMPAARPPHPTAEKRQHALERRSNRPLAIVFVVDESTAAWESVEDVARLTRARCGVVVAGTTTSSEPGCGPRLHRRWHSETPARCAHRCAVSDLAERRRLPKERMAAAQAQSRARWATGKPGMRYPVRPTPRHRATFRRERRYSAAMRHGQRHGRPCGAMPGPRAIRARPP